MWPRRLDTGMLGRFGIGRRDYRNLLFVAVAMGLVSAVLTDAPLLARLVVGLVGGLVSAVSFLVVTIVVNVFKPDHW